MSVIFNLEKSWNNVQSGRGNTSWLVGNVYCTERLSKPKFKKTGKMFIIL